MGLRFHRSIKIAPGVRVNLSKSGSSLSAGKRGATINIGKRGVYTTIGYPGSGLSYRQKISGERRGPGARDVSRRTVWLMFGLLGLWVVWLVFHHWPAH